jgi:hypothetical protein
MHIDVEITYKRLQNKVSLVNIYVILWNFGLFNQGIVILLFKNFKKCLKFKVCVLLLQKNLNNDLLDFLLYRRIISVLFLNNKIMERYYFINYHKL